MVLFHRPRKRPRRMVATNQSVLCLIFIWVWVGERIYLCEYECPHRNLIIFLFSFIKVHFPVVLNWLVVGPLRTMWFLVLCWRCVLCGVYDVLYVPVFVSSLIYVVVVVFDLRLLLFVPLIYPIVLRR